MSKRYLSLFVTLFTLVIGSWCIFVQALDAADKKPSKKPGSVSTFHPTVLRSIKNDTTKIPLRSMKPVPFPEHETDLDKRNFTLPKALNSTGAIGRGRDTAVQKPGGPPNAPPSTFENFEGSPNNCDCFPPDPNGDVGPNNYVQTVNIQYQVWDKSGNSLLGPININTIWSGFGGQCELHNDGDPVVLYDHLADRWLISQFAIFTSDNQGHQCIAVSTSGDPTGTWNRYDFIIGSNIINDYPKIGVWPDGYYMTTNQFDAATFNYAGAGVAAFERDQMLQGNPAQEVYFNEFSVNSCFGGMLPGDLDGPAPPQGTPNYYSEMDDDTFSCPEGSNDNLKIWEFHVDWTNPGTSTFGINGNYNVLLDTAPFDSDMCGYNGNCIKQPGTTVGLDALSDRLMHRLQFRNFGAYHTLATNHTVDVDNTDHGGVRWYELRDDGSGWAIHQQGTYAPDGDSRWMGSVALDSAGNLAVGYSVSSSTTFPSIRYAARLASDPLGDLSQGESEIIAGTGSQTGVDSSGRGRWGDYSGMTVDSSPGSSGGIDCDFWYTTEYIKTTGPVSWQTRVGAFSFAPGACGGPSGTLQGTVTDSNTSNLIAGAKVEAGGFSTTTDANGFYKFILAVGAYDVKASAYGYFSQTKNGVAVTDGGTTIADFALDPAPIVAVTGTVTDGSGHGWPLYARIDISGFPGGPVFTNPITGTYSVNLVQDQPYVFNVSAISPGYNPESRSVTPPAGGSTENFALIVDSGSCIAPGYGFAAGTPVFADDFESGFGNWSATGLWQPQSQTDACGSLVAPFPSPMHDAYYGIHNGTVCNYDTGSTTTGSLTLNAPFLVPSTGNTVFSFWSFEQTECNGDCGFDNRFIEVSTDGGATWTQLGKGATENIWYQKSFSLTPYAGSNALVRFRFDSVDGVANNFFGWMVDSVDVQNAECVANPGGLMVGNVYDINSGLGLNGATVTSDGNPTDKATSIATPNDPNVDDGLYILFSSLTGQQSFTASKNTYGNDTELVTIVPDSIVPQNFNLGAGFITVTPPNLEVTVPFGTTSMVPLTLNNTGTAPASFELQEGNGHTNSLGKMLGAPVKRIPGHYVPTRFGYVPPRGKAEGPEKAVDAKEEQAPNAPPWTDIAAYPNAIMDNTAAEIDGKIYSVGGFDGGSIINNGFVYDPGLNTWTPIAGMTVAREKPAVAAIDGKLYVTGGWDTNGIPSPILEIYDPTTDSWSTGASEPNAFAASTGVNVDGKFFVIGGCTSACGVTNVQVYDPGSDSWSNAASYPEPISWQACGEIGGQVYCAGGVAANESMHTYAYDPATDTWTPKADMPQTQWAMGFTPSDDSLYISGGVTNNFSIVTNQGFVYDPGADAWAPIANSNNSVYRGASACGFYKIGGSIGGFSPVSNSEVFPGLTNCGGVVDVPWLSENPSSGTIPNGQNQIVQVTFDATNLFQPGDFLAHLRVKEDTPYTVPDVQVTMHVPIPADWGTLEGTVNGLAQCDINPAPLNKATVFVDTAGTDYTLQTDVNGHYKISFPAADGPVTITVSANKYVQQVRSNVVMTAGQTTTEDFTLRLDAPCITADPSTMEATLDLGDNTTQQVTLTNTGAGAASFVLLEGKGHTAAPSMKLKGAPLNRVNGQFSPLSAALNAKAKSIVPPAAPQTINAPPWTNIAAYPGPIMDNTAAEIDGKIYSVGGFDGGNILNSGNVYDPISDSWSPIASMTGEREKPVVVAIDGKLYVTGGWDQFGTPDPTLEIYDPSTDSWSTGAPEPVAFAASTGVNLDGRFFVIGGCTSSCGVTNVQVYDPSTDSWSTAANYPEPISWQACGAISGQIYCAGGVAANESMHTYVYDPGSDTWSPKADMPQTQWAMGYVASDNLLYISGGVTNNFSTVTNQGFSYDPTADSWSAIANSNNTVYRGASACGFYKIGGSVGGFSPVSSSEVYPGLTNCGGAVDIPWLSESPDSGDLAPDGGTAQFDVTYDASQVSDPGDYLAHIRIQDNTPYNAPDIQVTMHVNVPNLTVADYSHAEGNSGVTGFTVTVSLSKTPLTNVTVDYSTADGTATAGVDYVAKSGTLTIPAGQTSGTITINVIGDLDVEPDETFFVNLSNSHGASITDNQAQVTITNDDAACSTITLDDTLPDGKTKKAYTGTIKANGGTSPYTYALAEGEIPPGLTLSSDGTLSGTPTDSGTYAFEVTATDSKGCQGEWVYSVDIKGKK